MRLHGGDQPDGEILLTELSRIAVATQDLVRRIAKSMIGRRQPGPGRASIARASDLRLVGLHKGSTVLEIAGAAPDEQTALEFDIPTDLGDLSLTMLVDGVRALAGDNPEPDLPVGYSQALVDDLDKWLRSFRGFDTVGIEATVAGKTKQVKLAPKTARGRLAQATPQPSLPFISAKDQVLEGKLYALNLNTGTFSIEDDAGHKIRIKVPADVRRAAAVLVDRRVRAVGNPELDDNGRLTSFEVQRLELAPDLEGLSVQTRFFESHELQSPPVDALRDVDDWAIDDLTEEESTDFLAALAELR